MSVEGDGGVILTANNMAGIELTLFSIDIRTFDLFSLLAQLGPATIEVRKFVSVSLLFVALFMSLQ